MKNTKGFTLVELLAVIVVLGILTSIVTVAVLNAKRTANVGEAQKLEQEIESFGADVYLKKHEKRRYYLTELQEYGLVLMKNESTGEVLGLKNPNGRGYCDGYLEITEDVEFKGYINCPNLYTTPGYSDTTEQPQENND